ncbi:hypothetical protein JOD31_002555 [Methylopila capsulata]|uniref:Uncharacterized protein n=1 Tax=Methylopila capsulata TaxID=61654 RepID=A0A9W6IU22_9HYPH|nr:hypothetical protein [Methylopila capsulata]MBM7852313.1 hypothetical protein [Methylopila capsulata]GLK56522.1 hypothetical protein GCM10008170_25410 [Methylopila capsulata]
MAAERDFDTLTIIRPSHLDAGAVRAAAASPESDLDDGETEVEDSGAGSFLDRFVPPASSRR